MCSPCGATLSATARGKKGLLVRPLGLILLHARAKACGSPPVFLIWLANRLNTTTVFFLLFLGERDSFQRNFLPKMQKRLKTTQLVETCGKNDCSNLSSTENEGREKRVRVWGNQIPYKRILFIPNPNFKEKEVIKQNLDEKLFHCQIGHHV